MTQLLAVTTAFSGSSLHPMGKVNSQRWRCLIESIEIVCLLWHLLVVQGLHIFFQIHRNCMN